MKHMYTSIKDTFQRGKGNPVPPAEEKTDSALRLDGEMDKLERVVADRLGRLKTAVKQCEGLAIDRAQRAEQLLESVNARVAALDAKLAQTEAALRRNHRAHQQLEESLTQKLHDLESDLTKKDEALAGRDAEINHLKSQLEVLAKGIGKMSYIFQEAELLASMTVEEDASTDAANDPLNEKPGTVQSNAPTDMRIVPEIAPDIVSAETFQQIGSEFAQVAGLISPRAMLFVRERVTALGECIEKFPRTRLPELLESLANEIPDEIRQTDFRERSARNAQIGASY